MMQSQLGVRTSQHHRNHRSDTAGYLLHQQQNDRHLSLLLDMLAEFNSQVELEQLDKGRDLSRRMVKQLGRLDPRHRSYLKATSLVNSALLLVLLTDRELEKAQHHLEEEQGLVADIDCPEYTAKYYLLQVLILLNRRRNQNDDPSINRSMRSSYKKFGRVKFNQPAEYQDNRLWENVQLVEILVYQYILIVQKLAEFDARRSQFLHQRGVGIARRLLGKDHKFARMIANIMRIRRETSRLIKMQPLLTSSSLVTFSQPRHQSQNHKRLNKIVNPEKKSSHNHTGSKTVTESSYSRTKSDFFHVALRPSQAYLRGHRKLAAVKKQNGGKILHQGQKIKNLQADIEVLLNSKIDKNAPQMLPLLRSSQKNPQLLADKKAQTLEKGPTIVYVEEKQIYLENEGAQRQEDRQDEEESKCRLI